MADNTHEAMAGTIASESSPMHNVNTHLTAHAQHATNNTQQLSKPNKGDNTNTHMYPKPTEGEQTNQEEMAGTIAIESSPMHNVSTHLTARAQHATNNTQQLSKPNKGDNTNTHMHSKQTQAHALKDITQTPSLKITSKPRGGNKMLTRTDNTMSLRRIPTCDSVLLSMSERQGQMTEVRSKNDGLAIITVNANGLRSFMKKGGMDAVIATNPDVIVVQEIKLCGSNPEKEMARKPDLKSPLQRLIQAYPYRLYNPSINPLAKGLHGTALFSKTKPEHVSTRVGDDVSDKEGRTIIADFGCLAVVTTYIKQPGLSGEHAVARKNHLIKLMRALQTINKPIVWAGDNNVAPKPSDAAPALRNGPGCTTPEQQAFKYVTHALNLTDVWATRNPSNNTTQAEPGRYTWFWSEKHRQKGWGLRLDHVLVSDDLIRKNGHPGRMQITHVSHMTNIRGTDHTPVKVVISNTGLNRTVGGTESLELNTSLPSMVDDDIPSWWINKETHTKALLKQCIEHLEKSAPIQPAATTTDNEYLKILTVDTTQGHTERKPYIDVMTGTQRLEAMVDTGADVSIISEHYLRSTGFMKGKTETMFPTDGSVFTMAGGQVSQPSMYISLPITLGSDHNQQTIHWGVWVLPGAEQELILGGDFAVNYEIEVSYKHRVVKLQVENTAITLPMVDRSKKVHETPHVAMLARRQPRVVRAVKDDVIEPGCEAWIAACSQPDNAVTITQPWDTNGDAYMSIVERIPSLENMENGFVVAMGIAEAKGTTMVKIMNVTDSPVVVKAGMAVAIQRVVVKNDFHMYAVDLSTRQRRARPEQRRYTNKPPPPSQATTPDTHTNVGKVGDKRRRGEDSGALERERELPAGQRVKVIPRKCGEEEAKAGTDVTDLETGRSPGFINSAPPHHSSLLAQQRHPAWTHEGTMEGLADKNHQLHGNCQPSNRGDCPNWASCPLWSNSKSHTIHNITRKQTQPKKPQTAHEQSQKMKHLFSPAMADIPIDESLTDVMEAEGIEGARKMMEVITSGQRKELYEPQKAGEAELHTTFRATIDTGDAAPVAVPARRHGEPQRAAMWKEVQKLLEQGKISESNSAWCAAVVLVPKPGNQAPRFTIDYRACNKVIVGLQYPLPRTDETLDRLSGSAWYTSVDIRSGFWAVPLAEEDREKTAFSVPNCGLFQWNVLPMGLKTSSSIFMQFMASVLGSLRHECVLCYIDDCCCFSPNFDDHVRDVGRMLDRMGVFHLQLRADKCHFFRRKVAFLGHIISKEGVQMDTRKIDAISKMACPCDMPSLRAFLGMTSYYRRFIAGYSKMIQPLQDIVRTKPQFKGVFDKAQREAFDNVRAALVRDPILQHPKWDRPFEIHCDGCPSGLGATLVQKDDEGIEHVICYASRVTRKNERNYHQYQCEALALYWSVHVAFRPYIAMSQFVVWTDSTGVAAIFDRKDIGHGTVARWVLELQGYDFKIMQRSAAKHTDCDGLSRNPQIVGTVSTRAKTKITHPEDDRSKEDESKYNDEEQRMSDEDESKHDDDNSKTTEKTNEQVNNESAQLPQKIVDLVDEEGEQIVAELDEKERQKFWEGVTRFDEKIVQEQIQQQRDKLKNSKPFTFHALDWKTFANEQLKDAFIQDQVTRWRELNEMTELDRKKAMQEGTKDEALYTGHTIVEDEGYSIFFSIWDRYHKKIIVPRSMVPSVLTHFHGLPVMGHPGRNRMLRTIRRSFRWTRMYTDIANWIKACTMCARRKPPRPQRAGLTASMRGTRPLEFLHIDIVGPFPPTKEGYTYILTMIDQFTRYTWAVPCKERNSGAFVKAILETVVYTHGVPEWIWSDREPGFAGRAMREICQRFGSRKAQTTGWQPQSNSSLERVHSYMAQALTFVVNKHRSDWNEWLQPVMYMIRTSVNETTSFSPFYLMFGREARFPVEAMLGLGDSKRYDNEEHYGLQLSKAVEEAYTDVRERQLIARERDRKRRDGLIEHEQNVDNKKPKRYTEEGMLRGSWVNMWEPDRDVALGKIPRKLEYRYTGPHSVFEVSECLRFRWILHTRRGKLLKVNVNRLRTWTPWNDEHLYTEPHMVEHSEEEEKNEKEELEMDWESFKTVGDIVLIPLEGDEREPFCIAMLLEKRDNHPNGHLVQWMFNLKSNLTGTYRKGWLQKDKRKGASPTSTQHYFSDKPRAQGHKPYTNDTNKVKIEDDNVYPVTILLTPQQLLHSDVLDALHRDDNISWRKA
jgi:exodeoxyribonuclease III